MAVKDYKTNPDENTTISGINIAEGCPPSGINNAIRQLMADVKQNSDDQSSNLTNYLPTTDGVVNGRINFNLWGTDDHIGEIVALNDQNGKRFVIDTWEEGDHGAYISLRKGSDTINPGGFEITVRNADSSVVKTLWARTDGNLWWDGKQIVRSVNGALADSTGNVAVSSISGNAATATRAYYADSAGAASQAHIMLNCYAAMGHTVTLPSGGTWAYFRTSPSSYNYPEDLAAGTAAGGTSFSFGAGPGGILAVRIA